MVKILYEDNHLLALDKPAGLLTQPSGTSQPSLEEEAKGYLKERDKKPGNVFLEAVHRLDKKVGGIVLFAKSQKGLARMQEAMRKREVQKTYHAVVHGHLSPANASLRHTLIHEDHLAVVDPEGKEALLYYKTLELYKNKSLLEIELVTGRYHQIRVQLSEVGHPIVGDAKYGSCDDKETIALTHVKMVFVHPTLKHSITVLL